MVDHPKNAKEYQKSKKVEEMAGETSGLIFKIGFKTKTQATTDSNVDSQEEMAGELDLVVGTKDTDSEFSERLMLYCYFMLPL